MLFIFMAPAYDPLATSLLRSVQLHFIIGAFNTNKKLIFSNKFPHQIILIFKAPKTPLMKKFAVITACVLAVSLSYAFMQDPTPRYQNLKVLSKNTNKHEMDSIMKHYSLSLGVKCNFCHVRNDDEQKNFDFASDKNKHKLISRDMMRMTKKINKKYFEKGEEFSSMPVITCYSCHHGKPEPGNKPPTPAPRT